MRFVNTKSVFQEGVHTYISNSRVIPGQLESSDHGVYEPLTFSRDRGVAHPLILQILPSTLDQANSSLLVRCQHRNEPWRGRGEERRRRNRNTCVQQWIKLNLAAEDLQVFISYSSIENLGCVSKSLLSAETSCFMLGGPKSKGKLLSVLLVIDSKHMLRYWNSINLKDSYKHFNRHRWFYEKIKGGYMFPPSHKI
jgi:hypothetical protein